MRNKMKKTQLTRVKMKLKRDGFITRNECIRNYITRLSAIILILRNQGWDFKTSDIKGDYKYELLRVGE